MAPGAPGEKDFLGDAAFWQEAWRREREHSFLARERPDRGGRFYWNRRAERFARRTFGPEGRQRVAELLHWLGHRGGLDPEMEVLDIGCGPGLYALALARRVKRVVALDPSERMLALLQEAAVREGLTNIEPVALSWDEANLSRLGWEGRFDLVLACMCPAIKDAESLAKTARASRHFCYYTGYVKRRDGAHEELWRQIMGESLPPWSRDPLYAFHLLYAWGYCPSLELSGRTVARELSPGEAVAELEDFLWPFLEVDEKVKEKITAYVTAKSDGGLFRVEREEVVGRVTWVVA